MDRLLWMHCFARAVETGSLSAVARELGIGQPNVSRHLASLEAQVGARLMHRSTRRLTLTSEGERYYAELRPALDALREAESNARGEDHPAGLLRATAPTALARYKILPLVKPFLARYPEIDLDLQIGDRMIDLVEEGVDVAIRVGDLRDSALRARRIGTARRVCVASSDYLAAHGTPQTPLDLPRHQCVLFSLLATGAVWPFERAPITVGGRFRVNSLEGVRAAVLDGLGIALMPRWLFADEIASGRVQVLMPDWGIPSLPIHAIYAEKRLLPRRARVFIDYLDAEFSADPLLRTLPAP